MNIFMTGFSIDMEASKLLEEVKNNFISKDDIHLLKAIKCPKKNTVWSCWNILYFFLESDDRNSSYTYYYYMEAIQLTTY